MCQRDKNENRRSEVLGGRSLQSPVVHDATGTHSELISLKHKRLSWGFQIPPPPRVKLLRAFAVLSKSHKAFLVLLCIRKQPSTIETNLFFQLIAIVVQKRSHCTMSGECLHCNCSLPFQNAHLLTLAKVNSAAMVFRYSNHSRHLQGEVIRQNLQLSCDSTRHRTPLLQLRSQEWNFFFDLMTSNGGALRPGWAPELCKCSEQQRPPERCNVFWGVM